MTLDSLRLTVSHGGLTYPDFPLAALRAAGVPEAVLRDRVIDVLSREVDARAESLRARLITPGAGQALEYQEAQAQAFAALAGAPADATPERYPMLAASIDLDTDPQTGAAAIDVLGVARAVTAAYRAWLAPGAAIRAARLRGKAAIASSGTPEAAVAAFHGITWEGSPD